jgi:hypothetical protein
MLAIIASSCVIDHLKLELLINKIQKFIFYHAENTVLLRYKIRPVVSFKYHTKLNSLCEKSADFLNVATNGTYTYHPALRG